MMRWMAPLRHLGAKVLVGRRPPANREPSMNEITTIGLGLAKHVFQVHGVDAAGGDGLRKQLRRAQVLAFFSRLPRCLVGMEACATAHYGARELSALGHEVRLMPAQYVKAYIKRTKPSRGGGISEQDGAHRLGGDKPAGELPARSHGGLGCQAKLW